MSVLTEFKPDAKRRKPLWECMKNYDVGDRSFDWPNNMISTKTVVYENGTIARKGEAVVSWFSGKWNSASAALANQGGVLPTSRGILPRRFIAWCKSRRKEGGKRTHRRSFGLRP